MQHGGVVAKAPGFARLAVADIDLLEDGGDKSPAQTPRRDGEQALTGGRAAVCGRVGGQPCLAALACCSECGTSRCLHYTDPTVSPTPALPAR